MYLYFWNLWKSRPSWPVCFRLCLGTLFTLYHFGSINALNTILFFIAMVVFDMATTAINNTMDYVKAKNLVYRDEENILGKAWISVKQAATDHRFDDRVRGVARVDPDGADQSVAVGDRGALLCNRDPVYVRTVPDFADAFGRGGLGTDDGLRHLLHRRVRERAGRNAGVASVAMAELHAGGEQRESADYPAAVGSACVQHRQHHAGEQYLRL